MKIAVAGAATFVVAIVALILALASPASAEEVDTTVTTEATLADSTSPDVDDNDPCNQSVDIETRAGWLAGTGPLDDDQLAASLCEEPGSPEAQAAIYPFAVADCQAKPADKDCGSPSKDMSLDCSRILSVWHNRPGNTYFPTLTADGISQVIELKDGVTNEYPNVTAATLEWYGSQDDGRPVVGRRVVQQPVCEADASVDVLPALECDATQMPITPITEDGNKTVTFNVHRNGEFVRQMTVTPKPGEVVTGETMMIDVANNDVLVVTAYEVLLDGMPITVTIPACPTTTTTAAPTTTTTAAPTTTTTAPVPVVPEEITELPFTGTTGTFILVAIAIALIAGGHRILSYSRRISPQ